MRIKSLHLENIGPFVEADLEFYTETDEHPPVVLITGENGTGKSIILDAIRGLFGPSYGKIGRDLRRRGTEGGVQASGVFVDDFNTIELSTAKITEEGFMIDDGMKRTSDPRRRITQLPSTVSRGGECPNWVVDYWPSILAQGGYDVQTLKSPIHRSFLSGSLSGEKSKSDITQLICHFDYLRGSEDDRERETGELLFSVLERIVEASLLEGGRFSHVARSTYDPMVVQNGSTVSLAQLSSGNSYLIQNMVDLLGKMYSVHLLRGTDPSELCNAPGLLLIDEAENQLHPKWQKRFIQTVLGIFPNLQIIATTHSPFIISSVENARLFVCKAEVDHCIVVDETAQYSNMPVDEILMSPLFEGTQPFNAKVTQLIERRKAAILAGNDGERVKIETELKALNPEYFSYFDLDQLIQEMTAESK